MNYVQNRSLRNKMEDTTKDNNELWEKKIVTFGPQNVRRWSFYEWIYEERKAIKITELRFRDFKNNRKFFTLTTVFLYRHPNSKTYTLKILLQIAFF